MDAAFDTALAPRITAYLKDQADAMIRLLETLVQIESPSDVPETQAKVQAVLAEELDALGYGTRRIPGRGASGGHLYARPLDRPKGAPVQLLLGHCDTVWPLGTLGTMPFRVDGNEVRGPGTLDMKGGLVQGLFALRALHAAGHRPAVTPVFFVNSDEEVGSPESTRHIERLARCVNRVYVLEPALGLDGLIKTARKGSGRYEVRITGRSAHAGLDPEAGASAILELTHVIQALHALNDPEAGLSINVGTIDGGTRPNVVAPSSRASVDVRVATYAQAEEVDRAIKSIQPSVPGTELQIEGHMGRVPMERTPGNRILWAQAQHAAEALQIDLQEGRSGGVSDGNTTSLYAPTMDGLGAVGDGAHADHEFIYADKMVERSALLALLLALPPLTGDVPPNVADGHASASSPSQSSPSPSSQPAVRHE